MVVLNQTAIKGKQIMQQIIKTLIFASMMYFMASCNKNDPNIPDIPEDKSFCGFIKSKKLDSTRSSIDSFLSSLSLNDDTRMDSLVSWLSKKECVADAKLYCNICIFTLPPTRELHLELKIQDKIIKADLFIVMFEPPRCGAFIKR